MYSLLPVKASPSTFPARSFEELEEALEADPDDLPSPPEPPPILGLQLKNEFLAK
jgi:hypothetical protein